MKRAFIRSLSSENGRVNVAVSPNYVLSGWEKAREPLVGSIIARRYFLLSIRGKGGMSVVYKSKDLNKHRIIAIKTLRYQWADDGLTVKRFQREAQALSLLRHPAIVGIHDYGETRNGQPFFVMDYLTGTSLGDLLKVNGYLHVKRVRSIFRQVFDAVQHAHTAGLVHRDLKPGNIMLAYSDKQGDIVKIVDFGIAKLQQEAQKLTRLGEVWGSPVYMSPEQCQGAPLDTRSDIYSLGVCVFEALSGQLPFFGKNYFETMTMQINEPPPPIRAVRPDLLFNEELESVLIKALQKDPDQRFQSASEFKKQLDEAIEKLLPSTKNRQALEVIVRKPGSANRTGTNIKSQSISSSRTPSINSSSLRDREPVAQNGFPGKVFLLWLLVIFAILGITGGAILFASQTNMSGVPTDIMHAILPSDSHSFNDPNTAPKLPASQDSNEANQASNQASNQAPSEAQNLNPSEAPSPNPHTVHRNSKR